MLVNVLFAFGPRLPPAGRALQTQSELRALARTDDVAFYVVEVCTECNWNICCGASPRRPLVGDVGPVGSRLGSTAAADVRRTVEEATMSKITAPEIAVRKRRDGSVPIAMITAYDTPFARIADAAGVDIILVGDSVADNVLGFERTIDIDVAAMRHHVAAVARAKPNALLLADLPWMSYHVDVADTVRNAAQLVHAGAEAVKLEGGRRRLPHIQALLNAEIPVVGHLGLTPQSVNAMGGLRVQARDPEAALELELDAKALAEAGCTAIVLEGVPELVAAHVTEAIPIPTIGIGAGAACDGQVLVLHDVLGLSDRTPPRFVRRYADLGALARDAIAAYAADVRNGAFPSDAETFHASAELRSALDADQPAS